MPHRAWEFRVADIVDSIEKILSYTAGMSFEQFRNDSRVTVRHNSTRLRRIWVRLQGTSSGAYRDTCRRM